MKCPHCNTNIDELVADRLSVSGMYDLHLFHDIQGRTVDELIENWLLHNSTKHPAIVGDREVDDMGQSWFCPVIVLSGDTELRRVGAGIKPNYKVRGTPQTEADLEKFKQALLSDPDIPRLLAERP